MTPAISNPLDDVMQRLETIDPVHIGTVFHSLFDLIDGVNRHRHDSEFASADEAVSPQDSRAIVIKAFITNHIHDSTLGVKRLCQVFKISRSTLYNVLQSSTGVAEYILTQRAAHCRLALLDPAYKNYGVMGVAQRYGFTNHAHFSRVFRRLYGMTPSDWRNGGGETPASQPVSPVTTPDCRGDTMTA